MDSQLQEKDEALQTANVDEIFAEASLGAPVHYVDPDASLLEHRAEIEKGIPLDILPDFRNMRKTHLQTELGTSDANEIANTLGESLRKSVETNKFLQHQRHKDSKPTPAPSPRLPDWFRIGWTAFSNKPNPGGQLALVASQKKNNRGEQALVSLLVFLGWEEWHYPVVIFCVGFSTWMLARTGAGLITFLMICLLLATYYQTNSLRFRRHARDDILRELAKLRLEAPESVQWLNSFLHNFWLMFEPVISTYVMENIDTYLVDYIPPFLDSLQLSAFTLGNKPFRVDNVSIVTGETPELDTLCMDWAVSFSPDDTSHMTWRQIEDKVDPKVALNIRIRGIISPTLPVVIEKMRFKGELRVKLKFFSKFPYAKQVEACFLRKPDFTYVLKPVGGEKFGVDVNNIPGLQRFVRDRIHDVLGPMMYYPNAFSFDIEKFFSGELDINQANGVLAVTVYACTPLTQTSSYAPNPYVRFYFAKAQELGRTSVRENTFEPQWNETHFLLLHNLSSALTLDMKSRNRNTKDTRIARTIFQLKELEEADNNELRDLELPLMLQNKIMTSLRVNMRYLPVSKPTELADGTVEPAAESNSGILRFTVHECRNLGSSSRSPYAIVYINGSEKLKTPKLKRNANPKFEKAGEIVVLDQTRVHVRVEIKDGGTLYEDPVLGEWSIYLTDMMNLQEKDDYWWDMKMVEKELRGRIRLSAQWKPVVMTGLVNNFSIPGHYKSSIGIVRFTFWSARNLRNVEAIRASKSDPYVRVVINSQVRARTEVIDNNLNPEWAQTLYIPVHSPQERLKLEVMDWNKSTKDISLGFTLLQLKEIMQIAPGTSEDEKCYVPADPICQKWAPLHSQEYKHDKGELQYSAEFYPTMALPEDIESEDETEEEPIAKEAKNEIPQRIPRTTKLPLYDLHGTAIKYTPDDLVDLSSYNAGVLMIHIHEVEMPYYTKAYCQVLDDNLMPLFKTPITKGSTLTFDMVTDVFLKETDFSHATIEIKAAEMDEKSEARLCYWTDSATDIIRRIQHQRRRPSKTDDIKETGEWFNLLELANGKGRIRLSFDYIPMINFTICPEDSYENRGILTVTLLRAENLKAADKSGTSDPVVVFTINGDKNEHESSVIMKTLNPSWENDKLAKFTVEIMSRKTASFRLEVFDWNQINSRKQLGSGGMSLNHGDLESFAARVFKIPLDGTNSVSGSVYVRLLWSPQLLARKKSHTTVFSNTKRVLSTATFRRPSIETQTQTQTQTHTLKKVASISTIHSNSSSVMTRISGLKGRHSRQTSSGDMLLLPGSTTESFSATVTIVKAQNLRGVDINGKSDPYVQVYRREKKVYKTKVEKKTLNPTWNNERFILDNVQLTETLLFKVRDHNLLKRSVKLGEFQLEFQNCKIPTKQWFPLAPSDSGELFLEIDISQ